MKGSESHRLATLAAQAGRQDDLPDYVPTVLPVHHSVTYRYEHMKVLDAVFGGERPGYVYARHGNPTVTALEETVAALESGEAALAFSSGMAAIHAALLAMGARPGSAVVAAQDIYGATYALLDQLFRSQGVTVRFVDATDLEAVETACAELEPAVVLVETISNPLLKVADLASLADTAHRHGATLLVDNTFATPYLVKPLTLGADMVIHSGTKYLGGHGDVLAGIVVTSEEHKKALYELLKLTGGNLGPQEAWLLIRGLKTLTLRMRQHCENGMAVARWLQDHPQVSQVLYPGLDSHSQHALAQNLFQGQGYGGMVSFEIAEADQERVFKFFDALRLCQPVTTLGDICTLVLYPAHASHRALSAKERARVGIGDGLVRVSVGIEAVEDLLDDLGQALNAVAA